jgi:hypothetical protein
MAGIYEYHELFNIPETKDKLILDRVGYRHRMSLEQG